MPAAEFGGGWNAHQAWRDNRFACFERHDGFS
jgi:hypothetical protein